MKRLYISDDGKNFEELAALPVIQSMGPVKRIFLWQAISHYIANYSKRKTSSYTVRNEQKYFSNLYEFMLEKKIFAADHITHDLMVEYKNKRLKVVAPPTVNREFNTIRHFFGLLRSTEKILVDPCVLIPKEKIERPVIQIWTWWDFFRVRRHVSCRVRDILMFMWYSGARSCEAINLKWQDIDWDQRVIYLRSGKNFQTVREIFLTRRLDKILHNTPMLTGEIVFGRGTKFTNYGLYQSTKRAIEGWAENKNLDVKGIRHKFCSRLLEKNVNDSTVKELMGHRSWRTTENYKHLSRKHLQRSSSLI